MRNTVDDIEVLDEGSAVRNIDELCSAADTENRNATVSENGLCVFAHLELERAVRERRRCAQQITSSASAGEANQRLHGVHVKGRQIIGAVDVPIRPGVDGSRR